METQDPSQPKVLYCSFCGKAKSEVDQLVIGPSVCICNECIEQSVALVRARKVTHRFKQLLDRIAGTNRVNLRRHYSVHHWLLKGMICLQLCILMLQIGDFIL